MEKLVVSTEQLWVTVVVAPQLGLKMKQQVLSLLMQGSLKCMPDSDIRSSVHRVPSS